MVDVRRKCSDFFATDALPPTPSLFVYFTKRYGDVHVKVNASMGVLAMEEFSWILMLVVYATERYGTHSHDFRAYSLLGVGELTIPVIGELSNIVVQVLNKLWCESFTRRRVH